MKKALLAVAALTCMGTAALAGPNAGGTLILALSEGTVYSPDIDYCTAVTTPDCAGAVARADGVTDGAFPAVINVLAAFSPPGGRLSGITFGVSYNPGLGRISDSGGCGDFEIPDGDWPADGSGTAVTWGAAQTDPLVPVYWFAAYSYGYANPFVLTLAGHPTQGGNFADDDIPANLDPIEGYGVFGFDTDGSVPCPPDQPPQTEACCFEDGSCQDLLPDECTAAGGTPQGPGSACAGTQCPPPPPVGACCRDIVCTIATQADCEGQGGVYQGDGTDCDPNPCEEPTPTQETSWGGLKSVYR
jgi:hypothetical protein